MKQSLGILLMSLFIAISACSENETQNNREIVDYYVGNPLGIPVTPSNDGTFNTLSTNVKVFGAIYAAESCSYDEVRNVIVVPNRVVPQTELTNSAWISFINHDGSVHTARWIGIQNPEDRENLNPPLTLNVPLGSHISNGKLYLADRGRGANLDDSTIGVIRIFNMQSGEPAGEIDVPGSHWLNDLVVSSDGTIYTTQTGESRQTPDNDTWRVWKIDKDQEVSVFYMGRPLNFPNGINIDMEGNIVVVNSGNNEVLTFNTDGELIKTEYAVQSGSDGIVIMSDGTKYVSSVTEGGISRIRDGSESVLIAENIPNASSMCYDPVSHQLIVPMNPNNGLAFVPLGEE